jgi:predicted amidohydrolase
LAVYQGGFSRGVAANLQLADQTIRTAAEQQVDLIVFSETFLHGYCSGDHLREHAETQQGPSFQHFSKLASQLKIAVVYGYSELESEDSNVLYNSCIFIGKDGSCLANYRKTHLWGDYEKSYFTQGDRFLEPFEFEGLKVSMLICFDIEFPEPARYLALRGTQLLIVPTALTGIDMTTITVPSRALENHIFIAYANRCGLDTEGPEHETWFCGNSLIAGPDGLALARASMDNPELIMAIIDPSDPKWQIEIDRNPYMTSRRTDLYKA